MADPFQFQPKNFEAALQWAIAGMTAVMMEKRKLRGHKNIEEQGIQGVVTRMGKDKLARIEREIEVNEFLKKATAYGIPMGVVEPYLPAVTTTTESLEDDLIDVANYAVIAILLERGWWALPMAAEVNNA